MSEIKRIPEVITDPYIKVTLRRTIQFVVLLALARERDHTSVFMMDSGVLEFGLAF